MTVGEKIKLLRKRERMTQARLAEALNVTTRSVIYFERNQRNPSVDILKMISELFEVSMVILSDNRRFIDLTKEELCIQRAKSEDNKRGKTEAERFLDKCRVFFEGGSVSDEDMDLVFESLTEIFLNAKRKAKVKYSKNSPVISMMNTQ